MNNDIPESLIRGIEDAKKGLLFQHGKFTQMPLSTIGQMKQFADISETEIDDFLDDFFDTLLYPTPKPTPALIEAMQEHKRRVIVSDISKMCQEFGEPYQEELFFKRSTMYKLIHNYLKCYYDDLDMEALEDMEKLYTKAKQLFPWYYEDKLKEVMGGFETKLGLHLLIYTLNLDDCVIRKLDVERYERHIKSTREHLQKCGWLPLYI